jgi:hypothetical protein
MKLSTGLFLPALIGAASAVSDATVYIFQGTELPATSNPPTLSPEEARLVFAQRLGVSQYHGIGDASESTLSYINTFGAVRESLFQDVAQDRAAELVLLVNGVSSAHAESLLSAWSSTNPAFTISNAPSPKSNLKLVQDLQRQVGPGSQVCAFEDDISPYNEICWNGKAKAIHIDLSAGKVRRISTYSTNANDSTRAPDSKI